MQAELSKSKGRKSDVWEWALFGWPVTIVLAAFLIWLVLL